MPPTDEGSPVAAPTPIGPDALTNALQTRVALVIGPAATAPKWESVLSLCIDSAFDDALAEAEARRPVGRPATVLSDFRQPAPPRTIPVLKLFGSLQRRDFIHSTASYLTRRATWPDAVRVFAACAKGAPVLFLGVSDIPAFLYDLLAALFAQPTTIPPSLLFSQEDPVVNDPQVYRLVDGRSHIFSFDGKPEALVAHTADVQRTGQQANSRFPPCPATPIATFLSFRAQSPWSTTT